MWWTDRAWESAKREPAERNLETRGKHFTCSLEVSPRGREIRDAKFGGEVGTAP